VSLHISLPLSLSLTLDLAPSLSTFLFLCLSLSLCHHLVDSGSLSDLIVGGVDICAPLQQGAHHLEVPVLARPHKSRVPLDETTKEKNAH
jgi:hypothetical protein